MSTTGNSIFELNQTSIIEQNDVFLAISRDTYLSDVYDSRKVTRKSLIEYLSYSIVNSFNLGSMANQSSADYSKIDHNHDGIYNELSIEYDKDFVIIPAEYPDGKHQSYDYSDKALSIGNLFVDGRLSTVYTPMSCVVDVQYISWEKVEPKFGQIKFLALDSISPISIDDVKKKTFDGWLWLAEGIDYPLTAFRLSNDIVQSAASYANFVKRVDNYGDLSKATFQLKNANAFFKLDNNSQPLSQVAAQTQLKAHSHQLNIGIEGSVSAYCQVTIGDLAGDGGYMHDGNGKSVSIRQLHRAVSRTGYTYAYSNGRYIKSIVEYDSNQQQTSATWQQIWGEYGGNCISFPTIELSANCTLEIQNPSNIIKNAVITGETYPTHNLMPIMVYVGRNGG